MLIKNTTYRLDPGSPGSAGQPYIPPSNNCSSSPPPKPPPIQGGGPTQPPPSSGSNPPSANPNQHYCPRFIDPAHPEKGWTLVIC